MEVWNFIQEKIESGITVMLLMVVESTGSSPGRQGFKMAVANDGEIYGTIGGGIMEHKLVEKAKMLLAKGGTDVILMQQYHNKEHNLQSGMICSGSQVVSFVPLSLNELFKIQSIKENRRTEVIKVSPAGLSLIAVKDKFEADRFSYSNDKDWSYIDEPYSKPVVHIIGGGHVGLALSQQLSFLNFYIHIYDDRPGLNTLQANIFAHQIHIVRYENIKEQMNLHPTDSIIIVTVGYRTDKIVFKQLVDTGVFYLGMMGSDAKIKTLLTELENEGLNPELWQHCHLPIGIPIYSKTAAEIAVSIAAEIIRERNKHLPTGRVNTNKADK